MRLLLFLLTFAACGGESDSSSSPCARLIAAIEACGADASDFVCSDDPAIDDIHACEADYIEAMDCPPGTVGDYTDVTAPACEACAE